MNFLFIIDNKCWIRINIFFVFYLTCLHFFNRTWTKNYRTSKLFVYLGIWNKRMLWWLSEYDKNTICFHSVFLYKTDSLYWNFKMSDFWLRVRRSNFMRLKFNFFRRSNFRSWDRNSICSWDRIFLQNWSGDRIGPRGP